MKKLTIIAGFFLLFFASAFTTADTNVSARIQTVFEKDFASVTDVKWKKVDDVYVVSFKVKDVNLAAAYNEEAELLCITRFVNISQVPLNVSLALEKKYAGYTIDPEIIEYSSGETMYYINAQNNKFQLKIKSDAAGDLSVVSKKRK